MFSEADACTLKEKGKKGKKMKLLRVQIKKT